MSNKILTTMHLVTDSFKSDPKGYEYNGVTLGSVADFYNVSDKEKDVLFVLTKGFEDVSKKMIKRELSVPQYLGQIDKLNTLTKSVPTINISMNEKNVFVVSIKAELKDIYKVEKHVKQDSEGNPLNKSKRPAIFSLYSIEWEETERGWGTRPDGFSFHRSVEESEDFLKDFNAKQPKEVPEEYSRPSGKARLIEVSESLHDHVMENGSVWLVPKSASAYKTYDASHLNKPKNKM